MFKIKTLIIYIDRYRSQWMKDIRSVQIIRNQKSEEVYSQREKNERLDLRALGKVEK